jgi:hypothetical protein
MVRKSILTNGANSLMIGRREKFIRTTKLLQMSWNVNN